jgi:hypothetical protein
MLAGSGTGAVTTDWTEVTCPGGLINSAFGEIVPGPPRLDRVYVKPLIVTDVTVNTTLKVEIPDATVPLTAALKD